MVDRGLILASKTAKATAEATTEAATEATSAEAATEAASAEAAESTWAASSEAAETNGFTVAVRLAEARQAIIFGFVARRHGFGHFSDGGRDSLFWRFLGWNLMMLHLLHGSLVSRSSAHLLVRGLLPWVGSSSATVRLGRCPRVVSRSLGGLLGSLVAP